MASLTQYFGCASLSSRKNFNPFCVTQICNRRHFNNSVTHYHKQFKPTFFPFFPLTLERQKHTTDIGKQLRNDDHWKTWCSDDGSCGISPLPLPPPTSVQDVILEFYNAINTKDTEKFDQILSDDCVHQDLIFYTPFQGKENVKNFLCKVMDALGPNIHIAMESVNEGENFTASVFWHLEWKAMKIPFTKGCRFFECEEAQGKIFIRKIIGVEELLVKPDDLILKLLKAVRTVLDRYPLAAQALLKSYTSKDGAHEGLESHFDLFSTKHEN
ncbi:putative Nuclear transport factor 2 family protein [Quillaja saponaria]|uniref:Nuclear transport factor 2 family protein n=1 Tax=Quillaja saponaria TaxID=32244 RepID=A0AAD7LL23_QUISA|nr:putative Nuclear transport factor 2 family protein [Quillaja saponaria]